MEGLPILLCGIFCFIICAALGFAGGAALVASSTHWLVAVGVCTACGTITGCVGGAFGIYLGTWIDEKLS